MECTVQVNMSEGQKYNLAIRRYSIFSCRESPIIFIILKSVISSALAFCPSVTLKKNSYEGLAPPWKPSQIVDIEIRFFRKFQVTKILGLNHFPAGVLSKLQVLPKCPSVTQTISHLSWKLELGLKSQVSGKKHKYVTNICNWKY